MILSNVLWQITFNKICFLQIGSVTGFGQSIASVSRMITPILAGFTQELTVYGPGIVATATAGCGAVMAGYFLNKSSKPKQE